MCSSVSGRSDSAHLGNGVIHAGLDVVQTLQQARLSSFRVPPRTHALIAAIDS
jgi:hypothetical protein